MALPALSTGTYRYPIDEAARVAIGTAAYFLEQLADGSPIGVVRFVLFSTDVFKTFGQALANVHVDG